MNDIKIDTIDLVIIIVYIIGILFIGLWSVRKSKMTSENYFLAGRGLKWVVVGAALFASNISTIHMVGLAASGYNDGLVWGNFEWMAVFTLILLGLIFAPFYIKTRISTLPEFLEKRYGPSSRTFVAIMGILAALFIHMGMSLYAGAVVFESFFGISMINSIILISVITTIYTVVGGLKAVMVTESIQTIILIIGAISITVFGILALSEHGITTFVAFKAAAKEGQLSMLHTSSSLKAISATAASTGLTWYAVLLGYPVMGIWYWCTDQTHVQRVLGARSLDDAQKGSLFAGALKILPVFILVLPGVIGYVLFKDNIGTDANQTFPILIKELLPIGLKGIVAAALLAALMSVLAAALNSSATLVSVDIVKRLKPSTTDKQQVLYGRIAAVVIMILAMFWSTQGGKFTSIFEAINKIAAAMAPPITTVFLLGVFSKRGTKEAAIVTLWVGFLLGVISFCLDFVPISGHMYLTDGLGIPFMMQAWWLFCVNCVIYYTVSYMTPKPDPKAIAECTWESPLAVITKGKLTGIFDNRLLAGYLLLVMVILYIIFE
ncbi:sodium:solute symporter family transporter [Microbacter margulisiae]|uniref:SSS family solute:Na+ symporter n=1 Tax=Microbacter margulisiae TaxID=1350067 RepID=A0A7W5DQ18_9PORP|nr:sodium/solute symporter [Microbacter margulisiae]MBB3186208.1 SSS family solute:Na+ symporter [Microbacter margulisiae]